jgi:hypothetical protein
MLDLLAQARAAIHERLDRIPQGTGELGVSESRLLWKLDKADGALGSLIDELSSPQSTPHC